MAWERPYMVRQEWARPLSRLHRDRARPLPHLHQERDRPPAKSAPGPGSTLLHPTPGPGSPPPNLIYSRAGLVDATSGTGRTPATSASGLGSARPFLHRDRALAPSICRRTGPLPHPRLDSRNFQSFQLETGARWRAARRRGVGRGYPRGCHLVLNGVF